MHFLNVHASHRASLTPSSSTLPWTADRRAVGSQSGIDEPSHQCRIRDANGCELRSTTLLKRWNNSKAEYNHRTQQATPMMQTCKGIQGRFVAICIKAVVKHFIEQNSKTVDWIITTMKHGRMSRARSSF
uniref:Uncharacterized protein n=1 Tax=Oryza sativa subsp. japonica TaxID=39947 RepID=Q6K5L4_ORYSJ|nr:hypothetical protein [Oryza sativa Japonica Group]BAD22111.1 hypothetical protein [Oryza sativa Japonica Group]